MTIILDDETHKKFSNVWELSKKIKDLETRIDQQDKDIIKLVGQLNILIDAIKVE